MNLGRKKGLREIYRLEKSFDLISTSIKKIVKHFHAEMSKGLAGQKSSLAMIPTFVIMPSGNEIGRFIALDLGGTNFRILDVALKGHGAISVTAEEKFRLQKKRYNRDRQTAFWLYRRKYKKFHAE